MLLRERNIQKKGKSFGTIAIRLMMAAEFVIRVKTTCTHTDGSIHLRDDTSVCPGDFIITGVEGEVYPCKPGIFEKTYEKVEE